MNNHGYKIKKDMSLKENTLKIIIADKMHLLMYHFTGLEVFSGDYWNSIYVGDAVYDINLYFDQDYRLTMYPVIDNFADFSMGFRI